MSRNSYIYAASAYIPKEIVKSEDLMDELKSETKFGIPRTLINEKLGIFERRFVTQQENKHSYLASQAAQKLIIESKIDVKDIDCVIYCGIERDYNEPATAHVVQSNIGIYGFAFDISNACHGFCDGMLIADSFIKRGYNAILLVTSEISSNITKLAINHINKNPQNFESMYGALTVGDAGGSMLITSYPSIVNLKFLEFNMMSVSKYYKLCNYQLSSEKADGQMIMNQICVRTLSFHKNLLSHTLNKLKWERPDYLITHQVGKIPHQRFSKMTGVNIKNMSKTYPLLGNIASATIPVNITRTLKRCNVEFKKLLIMGAGSGIAISQIGLMKN